MENYFKKEDEYMKTIIDLSGFVGYDLTVAKCHLSNWGVIYLDEYGCPMDVEEVMEMLGEV